MNPKWTIEYDNDTGPDDDGFWERWTVTNGKKSFKSSDEAEAKWLAEVLNREDEQERPTAPSSATGAEPPREGGQP